MQQRPQHSKPRGGGRFIAIAVAALVLVAAGVAWALSTQVAYDEYAPVTVEQKLPAAVTEDTWTTVQFKDTDSGATYRQALKIAAGSTSASVKVMLGVYRSYEISIASEQSSWRYENEKATYGNSTDDGGNDTWTAEATTIDGAAATKLPATLKIGTVDKPVLDRTITLTAKKTNDQWESDVASVVNTVTMPAQKTVTFDNQGHGNEVASQVVLADGTKSITEPTAEQVGTSAGLTFDGWYTDAKCTEANKFDSDDFTTAVTDSTPLTLYANWIPAADGDALTYWISPSWKMTTSNTSVGVVNTDNYVKEEWNVKKSSAEIQADVAVLTDTEHAVYSASKYNEVVAEYTSFMKNDDYHLYTKYGSGTSTNDYFEFRIINVGAHDGDESALTFQGVHAFTEARQQNSVGSDTEGGWSGTELREVMQTTLLDALPGIKGDIMSVVKKGAGGLSSPDLVSTNDALWIAALTEIYDSNVRTDGTGKSNPDEGSQYAYWKDVIDVKIANASNNAVAAVGLQRDGSTAASLGNTDWRMWLRSVNTLKDGNFLWVNSVGASSKNNIDNATCKLPIVPCFAFGDSRLVTFDNQGHGNEVASRYVKSGQTLDDPTAEAGTSEGLRLEGWYTDARCSEDAKWDFSQPVDSGMTLYANWVPDADANVYWIAPAMKTTTGNTTDTANQSNDNYVKEEWNVKKSSAEIRADVQTILEEQAAGTLGQAGTVSKEYQDMMNSDAYHLYTKWKGSTADFAGTEQAENAYVECRILQVGTHDGGEALTFQATHALPTSYNMNDTETSVGGWGSSLLRKRVHEAGYVSAGTGGEIWSQFNTGFTDDLATISKQTCAGSASTTLTTSNDKMWVLSLAEYSGSTNTILGQLEGTQYAYYTGKSISPTAANPALVMKDRAGTTPASTLRNECICWMRSPSTNSTWSSAFGVVKAAGALESTGNYVPTANWGIIPSFAFGGNLVNFDLQGHEATEATTPSTQLVDTGAKATQPTDPVDKNGELTFGGWYTDTSFTTKWDFSTNTVSGPTTLYAYWKPDTDKYWIAPASKKTTGNTATGTDVNVSNDWNATTNPNGYNDEEKNVVKSAAEIQADVKVLNDKAHEVYSAEEYAKVYATYQGYMTGDTYHLYCKYGGATTQNVDDYLEFRIIGVGEHYAIGDSSDGTTLQSDGSVLTFNAVNSIPLAYPVNLTNVNTGGWGASELYKQMNNVSGKSTIYSLFPAALRDDAMSVTKYSTAGNRSTASDSGSANKFWSVSVSEATGYTAAGYKLEGEQYAYYKNIGVTAVESGTVGSLTVQPALSGADKTRSGARPSNGGNTHYDFAAMRSPGLSNTTGWSWLATSGQISYYHSGSSYYDSVLPAFAFGVGYTVKFDGNGESSGTMADQTGRTLGDGTALTANGFYKDGYGFTSWNTAADGSGTSYTDKQVADLATSGQSTVTLYAQWTPLEDYWIAPAAKTVTSRTDTGTGNDAYTNPETGVVKTQTQIQEDVKVLSDTSHTYYTAERYAEVQAEYAAYMAGDSYHLYCKYNGAGATSRADNDYMEFRIIQMGAHDDDGSVLTFQATNALPTAMAVNSDTSDISGWGNKPLRTSLNGSILSSLGGLGDDIMTVVKKTGSGGPTSTLESFDETLWIAALSEFYDGSGISTAGEGTQYTFWKDLGITLGGATTAASTAENLALTSVGYLRNGTNLTSWSAWLRSPHSTTTADWLYIYGNGITNATDQGNIDAQLPIVPCFTFGCDVTASFDTGDGGSAVDDQLLHAGACVTQPDDPTRDGYVFKGWYSDADCTAGKEFDFSTPITQDTTIYAKWDSVAESYWLNYAGLDNPEKDVLKTKSDIQADLAALAAGTGADYERVLAEYTGYMNADGELADEVHLYTKLKDGANTTKDADGNSIAANDYVEWRIVSLGEHAGDGTTITWQMAHVLPIAQQMNATDTNAGGYATSALHTAVAEGGDVYNMFRDEFLSDILKVDKTSNTGNKGAGTTTTSDKLWIASAEEVYGTTATTSGAVAGGEGTQYAYYTHRGVEKGDATNECLAYRTRAGGLPNGQATDYSEYHGGSESEMYASWWLRSPSAYNEQTYTRVYNDGRLDHNLASVKRGVALTCAMKGVDYTISKSKMQSVLKGLSAKPTALKFVTGESLQGVSGLTNLATAGIQEDGYDKVGVFQSADTATLYIAPMEDDSTDPADNSYVLHAPQDCADFLNAGSGYTALESSLKTIDCANLDTSKTTDMRWFFGNNTALTELNLGDYFDTNNATMMTSMFATLSSIETIDLKDRFDTGNVTIMGSMFNNCAKLKSITSLSEFSTSKVTSMSYMFNGCKSLTSVDVSSFDTSQVTTTQSMFNNCNALTSLDVTGFNTANVTNMSYMFQNCKLLGSLDVRNFCTAKVAKMQYMFYGCSLLKNLDVSTFDTSSAVSMDSMFMSCDALTSLDLSNFVTSKVTSMSGMFANDYALAELDVSNFITSSVTSMSSMFQSCRALSELDLSSFNTNAVKNMAYLVQGCTAMESLDLSSFDTSAVTNMNYMFNSCTALQSVTLGSGFDFLTTGTSTYLPEPSSAYITGADGNWYDTTTDTGYTPANLATFHNALNETRTYVAVKPTNYYWLAAAGASNPSDETAMIKKQSGIDEDLAVLHGTKTETSSGEDKDAVTTRWKGYMNGNTRLYANWKGSDAGTGANRWVEFRILQVGEHDGDGSAVTFMVTHGLTEALAMNTASTNETGWSGSTMRQTLNTAGGYLKTGLSELVSSGHVKAVNKEGVVNNSGTITTTTTSDEFWIPSYSELYGKDVGYISDGTLENEGSQYAWCQANVTNPKGTNASLTGNFKRRDGTDPSSFTTYYTWLRTPYYATDDCFATLSPNTGSPYASNSSSANREYGVPLCFAM